MHFFARLIASRSIVDQDMTPDEREIMNQHMVF